MAVIVYHNPFFNPYDFAMMFVMKCCFLKKILQGKTMKKENKVGTFAADTLINVPAFFSVRSKGIWETTMRDRAARQRSKDRSRVGSLTCRHCGQVCAYRVCVFKHLCLCVCLCVGECVCVCMCAL